LNAITWRVVPAGDGVKRTVPFDEAISVPLVDVGGEPLIV
jgi:hypothetical protein